LSARELLAGSVHDVARSLLGCTFLLDGVGGVIVEVEAYSPDDPASHAFRGRTERNASMFLEPGTLYVYRSYGIHWCVNVACEGVGTGAAVLLRALEPTHGLATMRTRRGDVPDALLCAGPGRLTQALAITREHDGCSIVEPPFALERPVAPVPVAATPRVGIIKAADLPWRYVVRGSRWVSRGPRPAPP
jgi:DNA-3-methyladenine glycosylase